MRLENGEVRQQVARVDALLDRIDALEDREARASAAEALEGLLALYGEGLARIVESAARLGGEPVLRAFAEDELVSHLLLLHGLHPVDVESRVREALQEVRPHVEAHGGDVEFLGIEDGYARLRLRGSCGGGPSSSAALRSTIEQAVLRAAPDLLGIGEDMEQESPSGSGTFVPLATFAAGSAA